MKKNLLLTVSIFAFVFSGTLSAQVSFSAPDIYSFLPDALFTTIKTADFNKDGYEDIIGVAMQSNRVNILINKKDGTFEQGQQFSFIQTNTGLTPGDFNNDTYPDFAVSAGTSEGQNVLHIYLNDPTNPGNFSLGGTYVLVQFTADLETIDFNNDGNLDLVNIGRSDGLTLFQNDGHGGFTKGNSTALGATAWDAVVEDLDGDGFKDIIVGNQYVQGEDLNDLNIFKNNKNGTFTLSESYASGKGVYNIVVKDINNDNKPDIVTSSNGDNSIYPLINNGSGQFIIQPPIPTSQGAGPCVLSDFNGDGLQDIAVGALLAQEINFFLNSANAAGNFTPGITMPSTLPFAILSKDFNNDNKADLAVMNLPTGELSVFLNTTDFSVPVEVNNFTGQMKNGTVTLTWNSGVESEFDGYEIEKSMNGREFVKIGSVQPKGNDQSYQFTTAQNEPVAYYRLRLNNKNGKVEYSNTVSFTNGAGTNAITITPNPAKNFIHIQMRAVGVLQIYDGSGKLVRSANLETGDNKVDIRNLSAGIYYGVIGQTRIKFIKK